MSVFRQLKQWMECFVVVDYMRRGKDVLVCIVNTLSFEEKWYLLNDLKSIPKSISIAGLFVEYGRVRFSLPRDDALYFYLKGCHPSALFEFDKSNKVSMFEMGYRSRYPVQWKCRKCGGTWSASPEFRFSEVKTMVCPYCSGKRVVQGLSDLATTHKSKIFGWDYEKNLVKSSQISYIYQGKVWWKCRKCGYSWKDTIAEYLSRGENACPKCIKEKLIRGTSKPEIKLYSVLARKFDCQHRGKVANIEFDILCKEFMFAVEYDGVEWHKGREKEDIAKNVIAQEQGYQLLRIRERGLRKLDANNCINLMLKDYKSLDSCVESLVNIIEEFIERQGEDYVLY